MGNPYLGEIRLVGFNFAPNGWAFCNGQILFVAQYFSLFNLIGTTYGGDGVNTFALPDLQGRVPIHQGRGFALAQKAGVETVTLALNQMPTHNHNIGVTGQPATSRNPASNYPATSARPVYAPADGTTLYGGSVEATGGSQPHNNLQPFLTVNFIISLFGVYPSQN